MDRRHFVEDSARRLEGNKLVSFVESSTRCEEMGTGVRFMDEQIVQGPIIDSKGNLNMYPPL